MTSLELLSIAMSELADSIRAGGPMSRHYTGYKHDDSQFVIVSVGSLVFLMTHEKKFLGVWHTTNLDRMAPGQLKDLER